MRRRVVELALLGALSVVGFACDRNPWDRKDAHSFCSGVLAGRPFAAEPSCRAVHVCANEATLSAEEQKKLAAMVKRLGCTPP